MTRKLTDEQVQAIKNLFEDDKGRINYYVFCGNINKQIDVRVYATQYGTEYSVSAGTDSYEALGMGKFKTPEEAIAYAEYLLNQRYCWLPQNNGWIMSGEIINLTNAGKLLELMHLAEEKGWFAVDWDWYLPINNGRYEISGNPFYKGNSGFPTLEELKHGITIYPESPIWDAVKGVE